jgi:sarcosine oxidase
LLVHDTGVALGADVVVVGAGINGLATTRALARRGVDVLLVEQFQLGHTRGSSHGRSRIFRLAYPEAHWVRLAREAFGGWRELEAETDTTLLELHGLVELVRPREDGSRRALEECGVPFELLTRSQVAERFPIAVPEGLSAIFQPEAGIVRADPAQRAFLESALRHGARLQEETPVESLAELDARVVVVTAGAWARDLLARERIDLPVVVTRETVGYFRLDTKRPIPSVVDLKPGARGHGTYALHDPEHGLKVGIHRSGPVADPDDEGEPEPTLVELIREAVARYFPTADPEPAQLDTCLYTTTDDERFILERHGRIVVGSACSGHGFKFAPAVGDRLAALALDALGP